MTVSLWRIASDTTNDTAEDMAGKGAASGGSRWNHAGKHVTYAAASISLVAWETRAHFAQGMLLPWNRILVRIDVPAAVWAARVLTPRPLPVGWNDNVLINPAHPGAASITTERVRQFVYDHRVQHGPGLGGGAPGDRRSTEFKMQERTRYSIDLTDDNRAVLTSLAKQYKITQRRVYRRDARPRRAG